MPLQLVTGIAEILLGLSCGENIQIERVLDRILGQMPVRYGAEGYQRPDRTGSATQARPRRP